MGNKYQRESKQARERRARERSCTSKRSYNTPEEAYQKGQKTYHCRHCGKYHRSGLFSRLVAEVRRRDGTK